jgi:hypothetical protein
VLLALAVVAGLLLSAQLAFGMFTPTESLVSGTPSCGTDDLMVLMAQTVPSATSVPCLASVPAGWELDGVHMSRGRGRFTISSDQGGHQTAEASLLPPGECAVGDAVEAPSDVVGMRRYERPEQRPPDLRTTRYYVFEGGCVRYRFNFHGPANPALQASANSALSFQSRADLVAEVRAHSGLRLCGAAAPPCPGGTGS